MYNRIFAYIKNESHIIRDWLNHHGSIVPWWAIHVYDNNSTDGTLEILQEYKENYGINVYSHDVFIEKGDVITNKIAQYNKQPGISIPLDADEFICMWDGMGNRVVTCSDTIKKYIATLPDDGEIYMTRGWLNSVPEKKNYDHPVHEINKFNWDLTDSGMCKKFFRNGTFKTVDLGYHHGTSTNNKQHQTDIVYLHYHDTGYDRKRARCEDIINGHGIPMNLIEQRIQNNDLITGGQFDGVGRANELININQWEYKPVDSCDVKINTPWLNE